MPSTFYCTAALTSLSDSISYLTFLFSEWRIRYCLVISGSQFYDILLPLSMINIFATSLDRLVAVRFPVKYRSWVNGNKINLIIVTAWTASIILAIGVTSVRHKTNKLIQNLRAINCLLGLIILLFGLALQ